MSKPPVKQRLLRPLIIGLLCTLMVGLLYIYRQPAAPAAPALTYEPHAARVALLAAGGQDGAEDFVRSAWQDGQAAFSIAMALAEVREAASPLPADVPPLLYIWFRRAAELGHPCAMVSLANPHAEAPPGLGITPEQQARYAREGFAALSALPQQDIYTLSFLIQCYRIGIGTAPDAAKTAELEQQYAVLLRSAQAPAAQEG